MYEIGSEFHLEAINERENLLEVFDKVAAKVNRNAIFLRCGRDAIGFVADDIIARYQDADKDLSVSALTVFIPALACDSMVKPFKVRGCRIAYYKTDKELRINTADLIGRMKDEKNSNPDNSQAVLMMNYYGIADVMAAAAEIRNEFPASILIEDVTHILMEPESFLTEDTPFDYHVGSIRKWLGIPDGAVAISKEEFLMGALTGDSDFTELRRIALQEKAEYLKSGDEELKKHFRGLLSEAEDSLEDGLDPFMISDESAEYLENVDALTICDRRYSNYHNLYGLLKKLPLCQKAFRLLDEEKRGEGAPTPFMLPIILDIDFMRRSAITEEGKNITRDAFETKLAKRGIYAPVLWPIDEEAAKICPEAADFSENMLAFWIDQRYNLFDMEQICAVLSDELTKL